MARRRSEDDRHRTDWVSLLLILLMLGFAVAVIARVVDDRWGIDILPPLFG
jgi:hypothetical protein